jgi:hypothetical protein
MKSRLAITLTVLAVAGCMASQVITAKLVDSRGGTSLSGGANTICTYRYRDARGDHQIEKTHRQGAKCPPTIEVET